MTDSLFILLQKIVPQQLLSRLIGMLASCDIIWLKNALIKAFIKQYDVDRSIAERETPEQYTHFNDFFTRQLKAGTRPIDSQSDTIISPADGCISEIGSIQDKQLLQAKVRHYTTAALLGSAEDAKLFDQGLFATVYLSPKDYHRVHMPLAGELLKTRYIPGQLFSVNNTTAQNVDNLFARNERLVCMFATDAGPMAVILVGAMIVAGINTVWEPALKPAPYTVLETLFEDDNRVFEKGAELGQFYLGSTAIVLLPKNAGQWFAGLSAGNLVQMGHAIGKTKQQNYAE